jgi:hypothetical protein
MAEENFSQPPSKWTPSSIADENCSQLKRKRDKKKSKNSTPRVKVRLVVKDKKKRSEKPWIYHQSVFLFITCGRNNRVMRAHFVKSFFSQEEMINLHEALIQADYWEVLNDIRGKRPTTIVGEWTAQGHNRKAADPIHSAGKGGEAEERLVHNGALSCILKRLGTKLSHLLIDKRGDVAGVLQERKMEEGLFGFFHLFMSPQGYCGMHHDRNDFISVAVGISTPNKGGALEIGGTGKAFNLLRGDVCILDSDRLYHGSTKHEESDQVRIVGLFIIWRNYLRVKGLSFLFYFCFCFSYYLAGVPAIDLEQETLACFSLPNPTFHKALLKKKKKRKKSKATKPQTPRRDKQLSQALSTNKGREDRLTREEKQEYIGLEEEEFYKEEEEDSNREEEEDLKCEEGEEGEEEEDFYSDYEEDEYDNYL